MTLFWRPPDLIDRVSVPVIKATCPDELLEIQRLWPWFEARVGSRGRKMYATADVLANTYTTCTPLQEGDDPEALGLQVGVLPGGRFRRARLRGRPPAARGRSPAGRHAGPGVGTKDQ